jgi:hypothetical protein
VLPECVNQKQQNEKKKNRNKKCAIVIARVYRSDVDFETMTDEFVWKTGIS